MPESYQIAPDISIDSIRGDVEFCIYNGVDGPKYSNRLTLEAFRTSIIKQIEALSYFSDDSEAVMRRFNIEYGQTE